MAVVDGGLASRCISTLDACSSYSPTGRIGSFKNEEWIDSFLATLKEKLNHISQLWNGIGLDKEPYEERKCVLKQHLSALLDNMILEEEGSVSDLRAAINKIETKVIKLSNILGIKKMVPDQNLPLMKRERSLAEAYKQLSIMMSSRVDRFRLLVAEHQRLSEKLNKPPKHYSYDYAPSVQLLEMIENDINELIMRLAQLYAETCNHKISDQVTKSDGSTDKRCDITLSSGSCAGDLSNSSSSVFLNLRKRVTAVRERSLDDKLQKAIETNLSYLHKLFEECLVDSRTRNCFPTKPDEKCLNNFYLGQLEHEIKHWQDYRTQHTDAIAAFYSWRASFARLLQVKDQLLESKHLAIRSKDVLKLEKEAISIKERILPQLESILFSVAPKGSDFEIFGVPAKVYIEETKREAAGDPRGTQGLSLEKQSQLLLKSALSLLPSNTMKPGHSSRKFPQSAKPASFKAITHSSGSKSRFGLHSGFNDVIDKNQSACSLAELSAPIGRTSTSEKIEWPKLPNEIATPSFQVAPSAPNTAIPSRLRAPRVAPKTLGLSASCSRLNRTPSRAVWLLGESPRPVSVVDLFGRSRSKVERASSVLKTPASLRTHSTKKILSEVNKNANSDGSTLPSLGRWPQNIQQLASPVSVKSDSVFATPIGRAPIAVKKATATPIMSASCSRLNQPTPRSVRLAENSSLSDLFNVPFNDPTTVGKAKKEIQESPACKAVKTLAWQSHNASANEKVISSFPSSISESDQSISPVSVKSETILATPIGRAPIPGRQNGDLLATPLSTAPSRLRTPRAVVKVPQIPPAFCNRLNQVTPHAVRILQESPHPISVVDIFGRRGCDRDATDATHSNNRELGRFQDP